MEKNQQKGENSFRRLIGYFRTLEKTVPEPEVEARWAELMQRVAHDTERRYSSEWHLYLSIACVAAVLGGIVWLGLFSSIRNEKRAEWESAIAELDRHSVDTSMQVLLVTQACNLIEIEKGAVVAYNRKGEVSVNKKKIEKKQPSWEEKIAEKQMEYNQLIVPKGKYSRLVLADGSSLHVNAGTKVVYPSHFEGKTREIYVDGEIFIDVKRDEEHPFIVKTSDFAIEVLGTAFNVNAYKSLEEAEIVLLRGAVTVTDQKRKKTELVPGELLGLSEGVAVGKRTVNADDYVAWTKGRLPLEGKSWKSILDRLSLFYGVPIDYDVALESYPLHGTIDLSVPLDKVLERIARTLPVAYEKREEGYYILVK